MGFLLDGRNKPPHPPQSDKADVDVPLINLDVNLKPAGLEPVNRCEAVELGGVSIPGLIDSDANGTDVRIDSPRHTAHGLPCYRNLPAFGVLQHAAEQLPDHPAVIYGDQSWTYSQLNQETIRAAAMLQGLGVCPGDRVGILLPNVPEYIIAANAIWRAGGVAVAISPLMVAEEVRRLLETTDCRYVVSLDMLSHLINEDQRLDVTTLLVSIREHLPSLHQLGYLWARRSRTGQWTLPSTTRCRWFWEEIHRTTRSWQPISITPVTDPAYILPTGGTTGVPKAVTLSHTNLVANAWQQYRWTDERFGQDKMLAVLPFFHSYGMSATVMGGAAMGATLVLHHRFNTRQVIRLLEDHSPTVFHAVPAMLIAMNERFKTHPPQVDGLRWVISGGAPLEATVGSEFAKHTGALVVEGYGLSESSPVTHVGNLFAVPRYGTIGLPLPHTECRIVDAAGTVNGEVPSGEVGELLIRGPQVMLGYWNDSAATRQAVNQGWLHTGDLAVKTPDGYYCIVGRKKDLIITSGFNVYPKEVEAVLRDAEGVADAAVVSHADPRRGEVVKAFVVMKPKAIFCVDSLKLHCLKHLSKYKQPKIYEQCDDLPRNFLGKVIRRELRQPEVDATISPEKESAE
ncbi:MAG: long-chain fatty acid--CoA ligase [Planctomycetaceae bacterium]|nr:long-chain fatty acid--CoA ligase [Planctomycetaceae bacterium]